MNGRPTDDERRALLAGDRAGSLPPDEAEDVALIAELLADPSTWAEPDARLEDAVVHAVAGAEPTRAVRGTTRSRALQVVVIALAAAAAIAIVVASVVVVRGESSNDYTAQLSATGPGSDARATAEITRNAGGFHITLRARGLPTLAAGQYYQAWLKNAAGTLVPIGTFSSSDTTVTLWSGVSPREFPTMTVTIEQADNVQASSGRRVLSGEVRPNG